MRTTSALFDTRKAIYKAFREFIDERPNLELESYGDPKQAKTHRTRKSDYYRTYRDGRRARMALDIFAHLPFRQDILDQAFQFAYSGRVSIVWHDEHSHRDPVAEIQYTPGPYRATEYRAAAAAVLWYYVRHYPEPKITDADLLDRIFEELSSKA